MLVLCLSFAVVFFDQVTKHVVRSYLGLGESVPVIPGLLDFSYVQNTGAAWGMLRGLNNWLVVLSVAMLLVILTFRRFFITHALLHRIAMGLMIGGIVGNLIDRLRLGYVVDFIDFHLKSSHFPAFNVADSSICIGVGLYVVFQLVGKTSSRTADE